MSALRPLPALRKLRSVMTLERAAIFVGSFCLILSLLGATMEPPELQLVSVVLGIALTCATVGAYRYPLAMTVLFLIIWITASIGTHNTYLSCVFIVPVLVAIVAYHGRVWLTAGAGLTMWVAGLIDPVSDQTTVNLPTAATWGMYVSLGIVIGSAYGHSARRYKSAMVEWDRDVRRRQNDLAEMLHNSAVSSMTVNTMQLEALSLEYAKDPKLAERLDELSDSMRSTMSEIRALTSVLRSANDDPQSVLGIGHKTGKKPTTFAKLLTEEASRLQKLNRHPNTTIMLDDFDPSFSQDVLDAVTAIVNEACINAVKYSPPGAEISLTVRPYLGWISLTISNPIATSRVADNSMSSGIGQASMHRIATTIDAKLASTEDDGNWEVTLSLPPHSYTRR